MGASALGSVALAEGAPALLAGLAAHPVGALLQAQAARISRPLAALHSTSVLTHLAPSPHPSSGCRLELLRPSSPTALCFESPRIILKEIAANDFIHKYFSMYS